MAAPGTNTCLIRKCRAKGANLPCLHMPPHNEGQSSEADAQGHPRNTEPRQPRPDRGSILAEIRETKWKDGLASIKTDSWDLLNGRLHHQPWSWYHCTPMDPGRGATGSDGARDGAMQTHSAKGSLFNRVGEFIILTAMESRFLSVMFGSLSPQRACHPP